MHCIYFLLLWASALATLLMVRVCVIVSVCVARWLREGSTTCRVQQHHTASGVICCCSPTAKSFQLLEGNIKMVGWVEYLFFM